MARVFVSIGSNVERERNIALALELLRARFGELQQSNIYESAAVGFNGDPFFNLVVAFDCDAEPCQIVSSLHEVERKCGRARGAKRYGPRTMDLDLLLVGDRVMREDGIVLPHEEISTQAFVLCPLAELAGERKHPVSGATLASMWSRLQCKAEPLRRVEISAVSRHGSEA
jgi:2-amino-4-hydroxy-6-hydroxymethyldihydropteridine diphosphokinase